ncbi:hypothetical protein C8J56DRAFT_1039157 [Mycena floridula]|nr:hypothetical protein C8J56DRAFT_1039157 [Mycena floridula]
MSKEEIEGFDPEYGASTVLDSRASRMSPNQALLHHANYHLPASQHFMKFDRIDWNRVFFKTYFEKRPFGHFLVNFNRIWVIRVTMFWFYVNSLTIYAVNGVSVPAMTWSATVLGGARILGQHGTTHPTSPAVSSSFLALTYTPTFYVSNQLALRDAAFCGYAVWTYVWRSCSWEIEQVFGESDVYGVLSLSPTWPRLTSILLRILVFGCNFTES